MANDEIKFEGAKEVEVKADPQRVSDAKRDTQVVTTEELNFLMPLMAGRMPSEEEAERAEELMNRDVKLGSVIQVASYMDGVVKTGIYSMLEDIIDTVTIHKDVLEEAGLHSTVEDVAKRYYEKKKEAVELKKEIEKKAEEATSKAPKKTHKKKNEEKAVKHEANVVSMKPKLS